MLVRNHEISLNSQKKQSRRSGTGGQGKPSVKPGGTLQSDDNTLGESRIFSNRGSRSNSEWLTRLSLLCSAARAPISDRARKHSEGSFLFGSAKNKGRGRTLNKRFPHNGAGEMLVGERFCQVWSTWTTDTSFDNAPDCDTPLLSRWPTPGRTPRHRMPSFLRLLPLAVTEGPAGNVT